ncbi:hypothetical protein [Thauera linaloolentis]|uniref:Uncharacterized protein n=1 Tax=Thauera linaloolentis (strain DSM 12138 / JCM 21573 / CCUG 41526 / CIP 105981 / IAM 15112 / NBRC 102519 / 47Lol) TaxID=1123367 RepID=N6XYD5_THAL4|nr:hypothetical protein [Thauera linaloolentis]ENO84290.1 hypothetical protein C666_17610 [Thauera linaloolentis 47Lol = DSM 12138]MCM8567185.1 hypothetical protein [Thauera linaloolentis]
MNNFDFEKSRNFLEFMIEKNPDNKELIQAYVSLIEKKTDFDIEYIKGDADLRKDFEKNQTERFKADAEITKKSIEQGNAIPRKW